MKILGIIFKLFIELIFARKEEYDFKSKHFRPGKVVFAGIVVMSFLMNFFLLAAVLRVTSLHIAMMEACAEQKTCKAVDTIAKPDKNQVQGSSDSPKTSAEKDQ